MEVCSATQWLCWFETFLSLGWRLSVSVLLRFASSLQQPELALFASCRFSLNISFSVFAAFFLSLSLCSRLSLSLSLFLAFCLSVCSRLPLQPPHFFLLRSNCTQLFSVSLDLSVSLSPFALVPTFIPRRRHNGRVLDRQTGRVVDGDVRRWRG